MGEPGGFNADLVLEGGGGKAARPSAPLASDMQSDTAPGAGVEIDPQPTDVGAQTSLADDGPIDRPNRAGRTLAMTVFTAVRPWYRPPGGVLWVKAVFWFARRSMRKPGTIQELSFIHFARWGLVRRIPNHGQPPEHLRRPLFMFESNYNGGFDEYIDAFAEILTRGMSLFWGSSYGWPKPRPVARFKDYIQAHELKADHYYSAYPTATVTMITTALSSYARHLAFHQQAPSIPAGQFIEAFRRLLSEAEPAAADPADGEPHRPPPEPHLRRGQRMRTNRSGRSYAVVCLTPIEAGHEAELVGHLRSLADASPLKRLPSVHFGRWLVIDGFKSWWPSGRTTQLRSQYLLFTASLTAPDTAYADDLPLAFLRDLFNTIPDDARAIWRHCVGYPDTGSVEDRVRYLAASELDTLLFYVGYPDTTVEEVRHSLALREQLLSFAQAHQGEQDPAAFRLAYFEEFNLWFPST